MNQDICKDCKHWQAFQGGLFGECEFVFIAEYADVWQEDDLHGYMLSAICLHDCDAPATRTGREFGCVHWEGR